MIDWFVSPEGFVLVLLFMGAVVGALVFGS